MSLEQAEADLAASQSRVRELELMNATLTDAANGLLAFIRSKFPDDFRPGGRGFTCPHHQALEVALRAAVRPAYESLRDVAAYLLDRADQYEPDSPCWIVLADAARSIMRGEVAAAARNGDFDSTLYARVDATWESL